MPLLPGDPESLGRYRVLSRLSQVVRDRGPLPNKELYENSALNGERPLRLRAVETGRFLENTADGTVTLGDSGTRLAVDHAIQTTYSFGQTFLTFTLPSGRDDCLTARQGDGGAGLVWAGCDLEANGIIDRSGHRAFDIGIEDDEILFFLTATGNKSGVLPTYWLSSARFGYVYWNAELGRFATTMSGDFPAVTSFTLQS